MESDTMGDWLVANSGFNSLQTGRYMESLVISRQTTADSQNVSIPFKREGTWKATALFSESLRTYTTVSIPFKREGTWKVKT